MIHRAIGVAGRSLALLLLLPVGARAHDALQRSVPAKDAHLAVAPTSLRLTFTSAPQLAFVRVQLLGADGAAIPLGAPRLDSARTVVLDITGPLRVGVHTVVWQIAGADGHPVRGTFSFTIAPGAAGLDAHAAHASDTAGVAPPPASTPHHDPVMMPGGAAFGVESPGYVAVRWATLAALVALVGAVAFRGVVLPLTRRRVSAGEFAGFAPRAARRAATVGVAAAAMLCVAAGARLVAQSFAMHGAGRAFDAGLVWGMVRSTAWGSAWLGQVIAAVVASAGFIVARRGRASGWVLAGVAAVAAVFSSAAAGHAAATPWAPFTLLIDTAHGIGAAGWLGGLLALVVAGMPAALALPPGERGPAVAGLVNAFSPTALLFAGLAALTGAMLAWVHLGSVPALWTSAYGRTLLLKLGVLGVVAFTGAYNWLRIRPSLVADAGAARRLRASASVELAVTAVVIAVTAVLVATPPPAEMLASTQ